jgi:phosphatidylserine/phosphatidylglycerophosphate/cardiolipin synthase-like enzyme
MMKKAFLIIFALVLVTIAAFPYSSQAAEIILNNNPVQIYFSPHGGCTEAIVAELDKAKSEILVQGYSFTSKPIAEALVDAHKRGVHTEIILDKSNIRDKLP